MKLYMFRAVLLSIIRSLFTVHSAMVYVIPVCRQLSSRTIWSCSKAVYKHVWHIPLLSVQWINSWWWTKELSETCTTSCQNKFVKLVHLVGFIIKKIESLVSFSMCYVLWDDFQLVPGTSSDSPLHREYRGTWRRQGRYTISKLPKRVSFVEVESLYVHQSKT
jgi:hypothetical protein